MKVVVFNQIFVSYNTIFFLSTAISTDPSQRTFKEKLSTYNCIRTAKRGCFFLKGRLRQSAGLSPRDWTEKEAIPCHRHENEDYEKVDFIID